MIAWKTHLEWHVMEQALKQAPEGSGAVTIPGGVQKPCRYGTSGHGLAGVVLLG